DDDYLLPGFFGTALRSFDMYPAMEAFVGREIFLDVNRSMRMRPYYDVNEKLYDAPAGLLVMAAARQIHTWPSIMWRRLGDEQVDESLGCMHDTEFILREFMRRTILVNQFPCAMYCLHEGSTSSSQMLFRNQLKDKLLILAKYKNNPQLFPLLRSE